MEKKNSLGKAFSNVELSAFCGQMSLILKSGISATDGLEIMREDCSDKSEIAILDKMIETGRYTGSFYEAVKEAGLFPKYMLNMVRIGEETGTMDECMEGLEEHYARENAISKSIRSSVTFPAIMIGMMIVVIVVLLTVVLPIFNRVFIQLGTEMTGLSKALLDVGNAISSYSLVFIIILAVLALLVVLGIFTQKGRSVFKKIGNAFAGIRRINEETASCRVAAAMALTLRSGLDSERSLELVSELNEDEKMTEKLDQVKEKMQMGLDMSEAFHQCGIFTGVYSRLSSIGQKTGSLENTMAKIADLYQEDIDTRIMNTLSVLEPALVVVLSLIVGIILLSVMIPLMGIMAGI